jgi:hypothetical protein
VVHVLLFAVDLAVAGDRRCAHTGSTANALKHKSPDLAYKTFARYPQRDFTLRSGTRHPLRLRSSSARAFSRTRLRNESRELVQSFWAGGVGSEVLSGYYAGCDAIDPKRHGNMRKLSRQRPGTGIVPFAIATFAPRGLTGGMTRCMEFRIISLA